MEKVKVSPEVAKALDDLRLKYPNDAIFNHHKGKLRESGWRSRFYEPLNNISLGEMYEILKRGYEASNDRPTPKTPRQMGAQIVRLTQPNARCQVKPTPEHSTAEVLQAELDYELASLHHAINEGDEVEVARSKQRLKEIHEEMEGLGC